MIVAISIPKNNSKTLMNEAWKKGYFTTRTDPDNETGMMSRISSGGLCYRFMFSVHACAACLTERMEHRDGRAAWR